MSTRAGSRVTVGVVLKNSEATVEDAISSITRQTYPHELMEMLVVDGGSKDRTLSIVKDMTSKTDIYSEIYFDEGKGLGAARQIVIDNASGEYLVWVDSDDMIPEDYVLNLVEFIEKNPRLGGAATIREIANLSSYAAKLERLSLLRIRGTSVLDGHGIFRLRAMRQVGGFDTQIKGAGEDLDMIARIRRAGWPLSVTNVKFYHKPHLWRQIWTNKVRDGYGTHYLGHRHKGWISVWDKTIPIVCILGFRDSLTLYKLTGQKTSFFVPLYKSLKAIPWWLGFVKSHIDGYGHAPD